MKPRMFRVKVVELAVLCLACNGRNVLADAGVSSPSRLDASVDPRGRDGGGNRLRDSGVGRPPIDSGVRDARADARPDTPAVGASNDARTNSGPPSRACEAIGSAGSGQRWVLLRLSSPAGLITNTFGSDPEPLFSVESRASATAEWVAMARVAAGFCARVAEGGGSLLVRSRLTDYANTSWSASWPSSFDDRWTDEKRLSPTVLDRRVRMAMADGRPAQMPPTRSAQATAFAENLGRMLAGVPDVTEDEFQRLLRRYGASEQRAQRLVRDGWVRQMPRGPRIDRIHRFPIDDVLRLPPAQQQNYLQEHPQLQRQWDQRFNAAGRGPAGSGGTSGGR
ncbi:MAG: hypothetical protein JNK05_30550 [Myxococcales bacterium]|nr:hypothetical protein [Myxococcales bacterium]